MRKIRLERRKTKNDHQVMNVERLVMFVLPSVDLAFSFFAF